MTLTIVGLVIIGLGAVLIIVGIVFSWAEFQKEKELGGP